VLEGVTVLLTLLLSLAFGDLARGGEAFGLGIRERVRAVNSVMAAISPMLRAGRVSRS
jgi:hypothetical protein